MGDHQEASGSFPGKEAQVCRVHRAPDRAQELRHPEGQAFRWFHQAAKRARERLSCCVLGDAFHIDQATANGVDCLDVEALKAFNKDKKKVKKLANKYSFFLASQPIMKQIPRLLGPTMHKLGKFPTLIERTEDMMDKIQGIKSTVKFQLKKVLTLGVACAHVEMTEQQIYANVQITVNFLVSLLKKNWQNIKTLHIKSTMGNSHRIY